MRYTSICGLQGSKVIYTDWVLICMQHLNALLSKVFASNRSNTALHMGEALTTHEDIKNIRKAKVKIWQAGFEPSYTCLYHCLCECASLRSWSKLQKWYPNYTQVGTLAKPGGCLYTVRSGTPHVSPPLGAQFLCRHQTLGEYPTLTPRYCFCLLPTTGEGWPKSYEA